MVFKNAYEEIHSICNGFNFYFLLSKIFARSDTPNDLFWALHMFIALYMHLLLMQISSYLALIL